MQNNVHKNMEVNLWNTSTPDFASEVALQSDC